MIFRIFVLLAMFISVSKAGTFMNPLTPGADPWVIQYNNSYYYCRSEGDAIVVFKSKKLQNIAVGEKKIVYKPPQGKPYSKEIWAPELHHINNKWYIYFAADDGNNNNHRMYVIESDKPQGIYVFKGKITDKSNKWAIDGTVMQANKQLYFVWSGWMGDKNYRQDLFIAKMSNPWTIIGDRVLISMPTQEWEKKSQPHVPGGINEGPDRKSVV